MFEKITGNEQISGIWELISTPDLWTEISVTFGNMMDESFLYSLTSSHDSFSKRNSIVPFITSSSIWFEQKEGRPERKDTKLQSPSSQPQEDI